MLRHLGNPLFGEADDGGGDADGRGEPAVGREHGNREAAHAGMILLVIQRVTALADQLQIPLYLDGLGERAGCAPVQRPATSGFW